MSFGTREALITDWSPCRSTFLTQVDLPRSYADLAYTDNVLNQPIQYKFPSATS